AVPPPLQISLSLFLSFQSSSNSHSHIRSHPSNFQIRYFHFIFVRSFPPYLFGFHGAGCLWWSFGDAEVWRCGGAAVRRSGSAAMRRCRVSRGDLSALVTSSGGNFDSAGDGGVHR
ncbi:hypothetical protein VIGAN_02116600, partial [Vigna angularis var. angularis]